jgi:hypothetical protein
MTAPPPSVPAVLAQVNAQCRVLKVQLDEFMKDGDPLHSGELSTERFRTALVRAGLHLSEREFLAVADEFRSHRRRGELVDTRAFLAALPGASGEVRESPESEEWSEDIQRIVEKMKGFIRRTRTTVSAQCSRARHRREGSRACRSGHSSKTTTAKTSEK